jgi:hypothetical protein
MNGYYAYFTGEDGHITGRVIILATNDEDAKEQDQQLIDGHSVELWQEGRKVATLDPVGNDAVLIAATNDRPSRT